MMIGAESVALQEQLVRLKDKSNTSTSDGELIKKASPRYLIFKNSKFDNLLYFYPIKYWNAELGLQTSN